MISDISEFLDLNKDIFSRGESVRFRVRGGSMYPFIRDGDIVEVEPVDGKIIGEGDVIFYHTAGERMSIHRVLKKIYRDDMTIFMTKGDSIPGFRENVIAENVLGRVSAIERGGRRISFGARYNRFMNILLAKISPFSKWTYPIAGTLKTFFLAIKTAGADSLSYIYSFRAIRNLLKKIIRLDVLYKWEKAKAHGRCLSAKKNGVVIGNMTLLSPEDADSHYAGWWIFGTLVQRRYRGLGIGRKLTEMACSFAAERGALEIKLLVLKNDKRAMDLYRGLGFYQISIAGIDDELEKEAEKTGRKRIILKKDI